MRLFYVTHDGHSRLIAEKIADRLRLAHCPVTVSDLARDVPSAAELQMEKAVILVAPVRCGRHLPPTRRLMDEFAKLPRKPALALVSVNLTARKPGRDTLEYNPYVKKLLARSGVSPDMIGIFAGKLDYPNYRWLDGLMIRLIMRLTGGPTDPSTVIDYTDWDKVDAFADQIAASAAFNDKKEA